MIKFITIYEQMKEEKEERNEINYVETPERQFVPDLGRSPIRKAFPDGIIQKTYQLV